MNLLGWKFAPWQRRNWFPVVTHVPVGPRADVKHARRRIVQHRSEIVLREISQSNADITQVPESCVFQFGADPVRRTGRSSVLLELKTTLMFKSEQSRPMAFGIPANPPVVGRLAAQSVVPLASAGAITYNSFLCSVRFIVTWQLLAHSP